ncbi:Formate/nitrite transporter-domain-containing protein [Hyaloraphidium curvatum]|nr:Formate/nitrite transporter-domain-containing protein [Hyaloraphidium curvatum]
MDVSASKSDASAAGAAAPDHTETPPPLIPSQPAAAPFDPNFLLTLHARHVHPDVDFARPRSVQEAGERAVGATHDPAVVATLDRERSRPSSARPFGAQTLPARKPTPAGEAAYHLEAIARHVDRLRETGALPREDSGSAGHTPSPAPDAERVPTRGRTPVPAAPRTPTPARIDTGEAADAEAPPEITYTAATLTQRRPRAADEDVSPETANAAPAETAVDMTGSAGELATPGKAPAKEHDINMGKALETMILKRGVEKSRIPWDKTLFLGALAGFFTFCGAAFAIATGGGLPAEFRAEYPGVMKLIIGATFPVGIFFIVLFGGELFTGNTMILLVAFFNGKVRFLDVLLNWTLVYVSNMGAAFFFAFLFGYVTNIYGTQPYLSFLATVANSKTSMPWYMIFVRAIPANALVCLSIFMGLAARDVTGKIIGMWVPIFCFAAIGFEHCIANMSFITLGLYYQPPGLTATWAGFWYNQSAALLGNIIGGGFLIGGSEFFMYHWHSFSEPARHAGKWGRAPAPPIPLPEEGTELPSSNDLIRQSFAAGMAELDPSAAPVSRVPTLISTSDPILYADGPIGPLVDPMSRADSVVYVTGPAGSRGGSTFSLAGQQVAQAELLSPAYAPTFAYAGTWGQRPVVVVQAPPQSPVSAGPGWPQAPRSPVASPTK